MAFLRSVSRKRLGMVTLEVVMTTAVCLPAAAMLYLMAEHALDTFLFLLLNAVGMPYL